MERSTPEGAVEQRGIAAPPRHLPVPSSPAVAARMSSQARRDTAPELRLRSALHRLGLRYRVDAPLPGAPRRRADVLLSRARIAVFVDGCFWHACPVHATQPASNAGWWRAKLEANVARDRDTDERLTAAGWYVMRFWEHADMELAATEVRRAWVIRRASSPTHPVGSDARTADGP